MRPSPLAAQEAEKLCIKDCLPHQISEADASMADCRIGFQKLMHQSPTAARNSKSQCLRTLSLHKPANSYAA